MAPKTKIRWEDVKIEKEIPIPPAYTPKTAPSVALLERMEPNDSFAVPKQQQALLTNAVVRYRKTRKGQQFVLRTVDNGEAVRCWRIK